MILPPSPIIQKTFDFLSKSIQQTFITDNDNKGKLINSFDKEVYINERINRPDVYDKNKKQAIACYAIYGWSFGQITLRQVTRYKVGATFVSYEVIDGGHRVRAIREFIKNEFILPAWAKPVTIDGTEYEVANKFYDDLDAVVKQKYHEYKIMFMIYDKSLSDFEAGIVFNWQNKQSDLNDIEKFNAIQTMVSNYIRERSRILDDGISNKSGFTEKHRLFNTEIVKNKNWPVGSTIHEEDSRLRLQYILSQIVFWYSSLNDKNNKPISHFKIKNPSYSWDTINIQLNDEDILWKTKQKVRIDSIENILDELHKISSAFNNLSITKMNYLILRFVYIFLHELRCKYGVNNVKVDSSKFGLFLNNVISELKTIELSYKDYKGFKSDDQRKDTAFKLLFAFSKTMNFTTASKVIDIAKDGSKTFKSVWNDEINVKKLQYFGVTITPKSSPNSTDKNKMYVEQEQSCALDGLFCKLEDMDFAHDIARAKGIANGSQTNQQGGKLVWRRWNNVMGQMTIEEFKSSDTFNKIKHEANERLTSYGI
jgi:hypothetical protein